MKIHTRLVVGTVVVIPFVTLAGMGIGASIFLIDESIKDAKNTKIPQNPNGPKVEHIRSNRKRNKAYVDFKDIIDRY